MKSVDRINLFLIYFLLKHYQSLFLDSLHMYASLEKHNFTFYSHHHRYSYFLLVFHQHHAHSL